MNYNRNYFNVYVAIVINEMKKRGIKFQEKYWDEICWFCTEDILITGVLHYSEHNDRYLKQCYYNLQEKYDRGIINEEEFEKIWRKCNEIVKELR